MKQYNPRVQTHQCTCEGGLARPTSAKGRCGHQPLQTQALERGECVPGRHPRPQKKSNATTNNCGRDKAVSCRWARVLGPGHCGFGWSPPSAPTTRRQKTKQNQEEGRRKTAVTLTTPTGWQTPSHSGDSCLPTTMQDTCMSIPRRAGGRVGCAVLVGWGGVGWGRGVQKQGRWGKG